VLPALLRVIDAAVPAFLITVFVVYELVPATDI
jgi:hypothetical protein